MENKNFDAIVIGGGIHGCSVALHLAKVGYKLAIIEKDHVGRHASGVNAGGVRRLGRDIAEIPIAQLASKLWQGIECLTDDNCGFNLTDQIKVAETKADLSKIKSRIQKLNLLGLRHEEILGREELFEVLPKLSKHCLGGIIVRGDGYANPYRATQAFKTKAIQLGAVLFERTKVNSLKKIKSDWAVQTERGKFLTKIVVNCSGAWGKEVAKMLGDNVNMTAEAPMLMITSPLPQFVKPVVGSFSRALSFKQFSNGAVMIGGGLRGQVNSKKNNTELNIYRLSEYARSACSLFPIIGNASLVRTWAGIEGYTPDGLPIISPGQFKGVFHAFGFSSHGFQLAPAVGHIISELVSEGQTSYSLGAFRVDRFTNKYCDADLCNP